MNAINKLFLLLLLCSVAIANAFSFSRRASDTVYVDRGNPSYIIVDRGCAEKVFPVNEQIGENETQEQLLARVYGSEPLADSAAVYKAWADSCNSLTPPLTGVSLALGVTSTALGVLLLLPDYDHQMTNILGKTGGIIFIASGVGFLVASVISLVVPTAFQQQGDTYNKKAESWKLRVTPAINFMEPGGGLFIQLGF